MCRHCCLQGERKGTVFLKRHRVPKPDGGFYGVNDLSVGVQIDLYSRVLQVTDADGFTRAFMEKIGNPLSSALSTPADPYTKCAPSPSRPPPRQLLPPLPSTVGCLLLLHMWPQLRTRTRPAAQHARGSQAADRAQPEVLPPALR